METNNKQKDWNSQLRKANKGKNDEFYTQLPDIENELKHYKEHFKNKVIYCNCDDPYESNFFKYFAMNFNILWLKKLIATSYSPSPIAHTQLNIFWDKKSYKIEINEVYDANGDWAINLADVKYLLESGKWRNKVSLLEWDWDFRSKECIELLEKADIVVTNPPFSLFREYVAQLVKYKKSFLILGNMNAITYKEIFSLIKDSKMWIWYWFNMSLVYKTAYPNLLEANRKFVIWKWYNPDDWYVKVPAISWYTNLDIKKRHEDLIMYKEYNEKEFLSYENFKAINVNKVSEIPYDYEWIMWVPITFLDKYNPEQFEIIWLWISNSWLDVWVKPYKEKHKKYRKEIQKRWAVDWDLYMVINWVVEVPYARILIRKK